MDNPHTTVWFKKLMIIIPSKRLNSSIRPLDGILTGTTTPGQSGPMSNDNEGYTPFPNSKTRVSQLDVV